MDEILAKAIADQEKYDRVVKEIFDKPKIVATILRLTVPEFQGMTVEEVLPYILEISDDVPVDDISSAALRNQPQEVIMIRRGDAEIDAEIFDFLNGIFKSETDRVNKYTGNDPVIEEKVKKMGGFGAALAEKNRNEGIGIGREQGIGIGREQEQRERIAVMLRKGLKPEEVANYGDYPLTLVKEVENNMLSLA